MVSLPENGDAVTVGYIINLNANYFYLRFDYFSSLGRFLRNNATKTLAFAIRLQQNTKGNENDSHYIPNNWLFVHTPEPFMIVCVCNNISDREIRQAVDLGLTSMADLYKELGVGTCCGKCVSYAREVMHEHLESKTVVTELRRTQHDGLAA
jgi:bacterioferritin-associated ferredoxin